MHKKDTYCSFCGTPYEAAATAATTGADYPKLCQHCQSITYQNPLPVSVVLLPVDGELLVVRRNIPPIGRLALPGGFIEVGESWQEACGRELFEETGIKISAADVKLFAAESAPDGTVLIFGLAPNKSKAEINFVQNNETQEIDFISAPVELGFSIHTKVVEKYFNAKE